MAKVKTVELEKKTKAELEDQLIDLKKELQKLRVQQVSNSLRDGRINDARKSIARVLTIINLKQRKELRGFYAGAKYIPKDLRAKKTRAIRRRLTKHQASLVTLRTRKQQIAFPQRKYAIKA